MRYRAIPTSEGCCGIKRECIESVGPSAQHTVSAEEMVAIAT